MFVPIHDGVKLKYVARPQTTYFLIVLNIVVFTVVVLGVIGPENRADTALGVIPAVLFGHAVLAPDLAWIPAPFTLITSMFMHGGAWHLVGNMLFLWVFSDNVEDAMGAARFLVFYLLCGIAGGLAFCLPDTLSESPLIGASGAVSGVVASYLMLYPRVRVLGLVFNVVPLRIPAVFCVGAWILLQIGSALFSQGGQIGWWAHVGGIVAGLALTPVMKRKSVQLFSEQKS